MFWTKAPILRATSLIILGAMETYRGICITRGICIRHGAAYLFAPGDVLFVFLADLVLGVCEGERERGYMHVPLDVCHEGGVP